MITIKLNNKNNTNDYFNKNNYTTYNSDNINYNSYNNNNDNNNNDKFLPYRIKNIWRLIDGIILIRADNHSLLQGVKTCT